MVVKCINGFYGLLKYGKNYRVYSSSFKDYQIIDERGRLSWQYCKNFVETDEEANKENTEAYFLYEELEMFDREVEIYRNKILDKIKEVKGENYS